MSLQNNTTIKNISQSELKKLISYNQITGVFTLNKKIANRVNINDEAGYVDKSTGYRRITLLGKKYYAHRLAFIYMENSIPNVVDHINQIKTDNSWANLRNATQLVNCRNMPMNKKNTSGVNGVTWCKSRNKWIAQVSLNNKIFNLGGYKDIKDAINARMVINKKNGFTLIHGQ